MQDCDGNACSRLETSHFCKVLQVLLTPLWGAGWWSRRLHVLPQGCASSISLECCLPLLQQVPLALLLLLLLLLLQAQSSAVRL